MIASKGYAAQSAHGSLGPWNFERRDLGPHDVLIDITHCGVCHTDIHLTRDEWFPGTYPMVPGHEIVGVIAAVGSQVHTFKPGDRAAVGVMVDSCMHCEECLNHQEVFCAVSPVLTYNSLDKTGQNTYGGYANNIVVPEHFALHVAPHLDAAAVAPLLCAGITTYSPLRKWQVGKGHKLAVAGLGGLGHMAVKFGVAFGAEVTVLSTSPHKEEAAKALGAQHFVVTKDEAQLKEALRSFHFILDTVSANHDINPYLALLKTNGVYINVGIPAEPWQLSSFSLAMGNKVVAGSGAGGIAETQEMLDFCATHNLVSDIELIAIKDIHQAYDRMLKGDVRYRFVIDMATL